MTDVNLINVPQLHQKDLHLWWVASDPVELPQSCWQLLDPQEQDRALRFKRDRDRCQYVLTRSVLRQLLGLYADIPATELQFCYGCKGKPTLVDHGPRPKLEFNVSHSQNLVLWGISRHALGVDVEYVKPDFKVERIAQRFFTPREYAALQAQPAASQGNFFFQLWTRKEACIKAIGESLFEKIGQLEVPCDGEYMAQWRSLDNSLHVQDIKLHTDYRAAIASIENDLQITCFEIDLAKGLTLFA